MNFLQHKTQRSLEHAVKGHVSLIRFVPDLFSGECMNIGVCFVEDNGRVHTKMLDSFHRLKCLYDERITDADMKYTINIINSVLPDVLNDNTPQLVSPGANVFFGEKMFAQGESVDAILNRLYHDAVSLAVPFHEKDKRNKGVDTTQARKMITHELQELIPIGFNRIIPENNLYTYKDNTGATHALDIPIRGAHGGFLGTMISACQSEIIVKQNLLEANMDLRLARNKFKDDRMGCFVLRDDNMDDRRSRQVDNAIDKLAWKIKGLGTHLEVASSPAKLAEHIVEWSGIEDLY